MSFPHIWKIWYYFVVTWSHFFWFELFKNLTQKDVTKIYCCRKIHCVRCRIVLSLILVSFYKVTSVQKFDWKFYLSIRSSCRRWIYLSGVFTKWFHLLVPHSGNAEVHIHSLLSLSVGRERALQFGTLLEVFCFCQITKDFALADLKGNISKLRGWLWWPEFIQVST